MATTLAFDVYGTLIDTQGISGQLSALVGERAEAFARTWRDKQLEYSFRRGLMGLYRDFDVCTRQALDYCCLAFAVDLPREAREALMGHYRQLPAFPDAEAGLTTLGEAGHRLFAFSNGRRDAVAALLDNAGLAQHFADIVSVEEVASFKPDPVVYNHFLARAGAPAADAWLVSSNPFDVIGAVSAGMRAAWVRRSPQAVLDPWEIVPTATVADLQALPAALF